MHKFLWLIPVLLVSGCDFFSSDSDDVVVARVNESTLNIGDVQGQIPQYLPEADKQIFAEKLVEEWVIRQMLSQEADKRGIKTNQLQENQLANLRQDYIIRNMLNEYAKELRDSVTAAEVKTYYQSHLNDFAVSEPHVRIEIVATENRNRDFENEFRNGQNLSEIIDKYGYKKFYFGDANAFMPLSSLNLRLAREIQKIRDQKIHGPVVINRKYYYFQVYEKIEKGGSLPLLTVEEKIRSILALRKRNKQRETLIKEIRTDYVIETFVSRLTSGGFNN
jgi:hypothetical protein